MKKIVSFSFFMSTFIYINSASLTPEQPDQKIIEEIKKKLEELQEDFTKCKELTLEILNKKTELHDCEEQRLLLESKLLLEGLRDAEKRNQELMKDLEESNELLKSLVRRRGKIDDLSKECTSISPVKNDFETLTLQQLNEIQTGIEAFINDSKNCNLKERDYEATINVLNDQLTQEIDKNNKLEKLCKNMEEIADKALALARKSTEQELEEYSRLPNAQNLEDIHNSNELKEDKKDALDILHQVVQEVMLFGQHKKSSLQACLQAHQILIDLMGKIQNYLDTVDEVIKRGGDQAEALQQVLEDFFADLQDQMAQIKDIMNEFESNNPQPETQEASVQTDLKDFALAAALLKEPIITPEQRLDNNLVDFFVAYSEPDELERPASV